MRIHPESCGPAAARRTGHLAGAVLLGCALIACGGKTPPPAAPPAQVITIAAPPDAKVKTAMALAASADVNPDANGRPSPVVVRVYQLRAEGAFSGADFFPLFDSDEKVLGNELISHDEYVMSPGDKQTIDVTLSAETRFVGAIAAFRDVRNSQWRAVLPAPKAGLAINVERSRIVISPAAK